MTCLSVVEYETLSIVTQLDSPDHRALSLVELDRLHQVSQNLKVRLIDHVARNQVRFRQFVGLIRLGDRDIELLPKIESVDANEPPAGIRMNLLQMLIVATDTKVQFFGNAGAALARANWLDVFIQLFCRELLDQLRRGMIRCYRDEEDDLSVVRGRILMDQQLTRNFVHRERVACEFDDLDENHALNQLLKLALVKMRWVARRNETHRLIDSLLLSFDSVVLPQTGAPWWRDVRLDRLSMRYESSVRMANIFLSGLSPDVSGGRDDSFAIVFDMNSLFEEYIGRLLRKVLMQEGLCVRLQHASHFLMHAQDGSTNLFQIRPDIVVTNGNETVCIGDTKWKRLFFEERKYGVAQADVYQMLAYADRYRCERVMLVYPFHRKSGVLAEDSQLLTYQGRSTTVLIGQVDLQNLSSVPARLLRLYRQATNQFKATLSGTYAAG